jgi:hypothetical protein
MSSAFQSIRMGFALSAGFLLCACVTPPDSHDASVLLQAQGTLAVMSRDGSGFRNQALLLVRQSNGQTVFEIRDVRHPVSYVRGELESSLSEGSRTRSPLQHRFDHRGFVAERREDWVVRVTRLTHLAASGVPLDRARLSGQISSVGERRVRYQEGMMTLGRDSRVELSLAEGEDSEAGGLTFVGQSTSHEQRYALGTSGIATIQSSGVNTRLLLGDRAHFTLDLPERAGSLHQPGTQHGWYEEFSYELRHPGTDAPNQVFGRFVVLDSGSSGRIEVQDRLAARLVVTAHQVQPSLMGMDPVLVRGFALIDYDLRIIVQEGRIRVSGERRFSAEVERLDEPESTIRADLPMSRVQWPVIEW